MGAWIWSSWETTGVSRCSGTRVRAASRMPPRPAAWRNPPCWATPRRSRSATTTKTGSPTCSSRHRVGRRLSPTPTPGTGPFNTIAALRTGSGKNNRFGIGSTLELRAGKLYEARVVTGPVTHFGLGQRLKADVLRVRWPNGVAQTVYYPGTDADILEQQILKGSCPFLYAWDGTRFRFVTDVMWRSALGMPLGIMAGGRDIASAPPHASREYMRIPARALAPQSGRYVLQLTEELWVTAYLDQAKLLAVDHPVSVDVFGEEGFLPPAPWPTALRLYPVSHPRPPVAATDEH